MTATILFWGGAIFLVVFVFSVLAIVERLNLLIDAVRDLICDDGSI